MFASECWEHKLIFILKSILDISNIFVVRMALAYSKIKNKQQDLLGTFVIMHA